MNYREWKPQTKTSAVTRRWAIVAGEENKTLWGNYTWSVDDVTLYDKYLGNTPMLNFSRAREVLKVESEARGD